MNKHLNKLNLEVTELETQVSRVLGGRALRPALCPASAPTPGVGVADHERTSHDIWWVPRACAPCSPSHPGASQTLCPCVLGLSGQTAQHPERLRQRTSIPSQPWRLRVGGEGRLATSDIQGLWLSSPRSPPHRHKRSSVRAHWPGSCFCQDVSHVGAGPTR